MYSDHFENTLMNHRKLGKKLVIKPFKDVPALPDNFEDETWAKLKAAVVAVQLQQGVDFSQQELYNGVQDLCIHKKSSNLFDRLRFTCAEHIQDTILNLIGKEPDPVHFLFLVTKMWDNHCEQMLTIKLIFGYLDRTFVIGNASRSLWEMGLDLLANFISIHKEVQSKLVKGLLQLITMERDGALIDKTMARKLVRMLLALHMYNDPFEKFFLDRSRDYYINLALNNLQNLQIGDYLIQVEKRLNEENERVIYYLDPGTRRPLINLVEQHLLKDNVSSILEKGFSTFMESDLVSDLARLYRLLGLVDAHDSLRTCFKEYIKKAGLSIVMDEEKDPVMINELLSFNAKLTLVWEKAFCSNEQFWYTLKDSFESFINQRQNVPAQLIAKFLDSKLRVGGKGSEEEIEDVLDKVMVIFRFVNSKDVFEAFYKKDLAKRLLLDKSASFDQEKSVISKLKAECGSQLSGKLEGMFKDIDLSKDIMGSFKQSKDCRDARMGNVDLNVFVLTAGYWPTYEQCDVKLPAQLSEHQEVFKNFYLTRYQGRRLVWQPSLAHCLVKGYFVKGNKEFSVSLFQALVLLLFNDAEELSCKVIKEQTGIETEELCRTLQSLALGQVRVLKKRPKGQEIGENDLFAFAADFTHKLMRIKINQIQLKETVEEQKSCTEKVFSDRLHQIDAAIVRLMKSRKTLAHAALLQELFALLKFPVTAVDLKKRMESLIEREYMVRDESNAALYHYVA